MPTDTERQHVAGKLRADRMPSLMKLMAYLHCSGNEICERLADLIDPTCYVYKDTLHYEKGEQVVFRCGKCEEIVSYDEDYNIETDLPAYCERCGSRIIEIGEQWNE